jgi:hypothetical protein
MVKPNVTGDQVLAWLAANQDGPDPRGKPPKYECYFSYKYQTWLRNTWGQMLPWQEKVKEQLIDYV